MPYSRAKEFSLSFILVLLGVCSAFFGIKGFLVPNRLIDGGMTGVAMLLAMKSLPLPVLLLLINAPFIIWGLGRLGTRFALSCLFSICALALLIASFTVPPITRDPLLAGVFGGVFIGAGMGLCIRGGAVLDGTEMLALLLERTTFLSLGDIILTLNVIIFSVAAAYLGIEPALYSVITYWSAAKTADFILSGIEEYNAVIIISERSDAIRAEILAKLQRGVTILRGVGGYNKQDFEVLFCVITRLELPRLRTLVKALDEEAFFVSHRVDDATGGQTQRLFANALRDQAA